MATMKKVRALSFMRNDKSESKIIFVFFQNSFFRFFKKLILYTLNWVNKRYVPIITTIITGIITMTTAPPFTSMAVIYPAAKSKIAKTVNSLEAFCSVFDFLYNLNNSENFLERKKNVKKKEKNKKNTINEPSVTINGQSRE